MQLKYLNTIIFIHGWKSLKKINEFIPNDLNLFD